MGWFDEQIKTRKLKEEEQFEDAFADIAGAVLGSRVAKSLKNDKNTEDALGEILKYYRFKYEEVPAKVTEYEDVIEYQTRPHGIMRRHVALKKGWYKDAIGPMLATRTDDESAVALIPGKLVGYTFYDHTKGKRVHVNRRNEHLISEEAYTFYKPFPLRKMTIKDIMVYTLGTLSVSDLVFAALGTLLVSLVGMLTPALTRQLFGTIIPQKSTSMLLAVSVFLACAGICSLLFGTIKSLILNRVNVRMNASVSAATMMRLLSLPAGFFRDYSSGELSNYQSQINSLCGTFVNIVLSTGLTSVFSLVYLTQVFKYAPALVAPSLVILALTIAVTVASSLTQIKINRQLLKLGAKETAVSYEMLSGIQKIKLAGAEKRAFAKWGSTYAKNASLTYNPPLIAKTSGVIITTISLAGTLVTYWLAIKTKVSVADYYAFNVAFGAVSGAFSSLAGIVLNIAQIQPVLELIKPILDAEPEVSENRKMVTSLSGNIEINNVSFKYEEDSPYILDNLSLKIKAGQYLAIVGKTGCGKSTLVRLLLGFEKPQKGGIYYDSKDINQLDLKSLRRNMGVVIQDSKLFSGDIYSNITITAPRLTLDEAWEAAEMAGLAEDIRNMPMGMQTHLSEGEGGVSGGQRQRILIARAVAPKPKILIFDEATSALDNITQKHVSDALDGLKCTRIVIAHRLSTIKNADRIIVLDGGKIIEDGTYNELISQNGFFADLVARQRLDG